MSRAGTPGGGSVPGGTAEARFVLVGPQGLGSAWTGGNVYNRGLAGGLASRTGRRVPTVDVSAAMAAVGDRAVILLDSLLLEDAPALVAERGPGAQVMLLGHSLPSLLSAQPSPGDVVREGRLLSGLDAIVVASDVAAAEFGRRTPDVPRWTIPPAIDLDRPDPHELRSTGRPHALMVSNVLANKGIAELLVELAVHADGPDDWVLSIVGHTDLEPAYAERCRAIVDGAPTLAGRVRFAGPSTRAAVADALAASDVFVSNSPFESFGMALQEAAAFGLHVIARRGGNVGDVAPEDGELYETTQDVAAALVATLGDRETLRRRRAARRVREPAFARSWDDAAAELLAFVGASG